MIDERRLQTHVSRREVLTGALAALAATLLFSCGPAPDPIEVNFMYSTEKSDWLQPAIAAFNQQDKIYNNKVIHIHASDDGSLDELEQVVNGQVPLPIAWSPASDLEWLRFDYLWNSKTGKSIINQSAAPNFKPTSLVRSPLVFAVWKDRADALLSRYKSIDWNTIYQALTTLPNGWGDLNHAEWGSQIHLGQTRPDTSNSGLVSLLLMVSDYFGNRPLAKLSEGEVKNPDLWKRVQVFEDAVNHFGDSSGTYFSEYIIKEGPAAHAITMTYENLVLLQNQAQPHAQNKLELFYPNWNFFSVHPFTILDIPPDRLPASELAEQQAAAKIFRDFLLSPEQQQEAVRHGFRRPDSVSDSTSLINPSDPKNPFNSFTQISPLSSSLAAIDDRVVASPPGNVIDALIKQWQKYYPQPS